MRMKILHLLGRAFGISFKVGGIPFGAAPTNSGPNHSAIRRKDSSSSPNLA